MEKQGSEDTSFCWLDYLYGRGIFSIHFDLQKRYYALLYHLLRTTVELGLG